MWMDLISQDVRMHGEMWQGLPDIPCFTKWTMGSLIPADGLSSSFTPCSAALYPDIMLRDKYCTVSDQNIIKRFPSITYCSTRDSTLLTSGVCLLFKILTEKFLYPFYYSTRVWGKGDAPLLSGGQKDKRYWEEKSWASTGFFILTHNIATSVCPIETVSCSWHQARGCGTSTATW